MSVNQLAFLAPKQRSLTENETSTSFEAWSENMSFSLSLDKKSARFLDDLKTWSKSNVANRGFVNDPETVEADVRMTAVQKALCLQHVLGIIANYAPVISHTYIKSSALSLEDIFNRLRSHYGFRRTGSRITELMSIQLEPSESHESLWERYYSFFEGNLLQANGLTHEGVKLEHSESFTPTLLNTVVVLWLHALNPMLPSLVRQAFATTLRSQTIYSIREEISESIPSLLHEYSERENASISRAYSGPQHFNQRGRSSYRGSGYSGNRRGSFPSNGQRGRSRKCSLCYQANRPDWDSHYMSKCPFLSQDDKAYFSRIREVGVDLADEEHETYDDESSHMTDCCAGVASTVIKKSSIIENPSIHRSFSACKVDVIPSPELVFEMNYKPILFTLDSGAESNLMIESECRKHGIPIEQTTGTATQADGVTSLPTVGEVHTFVYKTCGATGRKHRLKFSALVVKTLSCSVLAGQPFHKDNDVFSRPAQDTIFLGDCCGFKCHNTMKKINNISGIKAATVLRVPHKMCLLPGESVEIPVPADIASASEAIALEPRWDSPSKSINWLPFSIQSIDSGTVSLKNSSYDPVMIQRNEHICQIRPAVEVCDPEEEAPVYHPVIKKVEIPNHKHSSSVSVDPGNLLYQPDKDEFWRVNHKYDSVFSPDIGKYNGHSGSFKHEINMGPSLPPQRKGRVPQYDRNNKVLLQEKFDELQSKGVFARPEDLGVVAEYVSPSFLVSKSSGGHRLVTAFTDIGDYIKPQPSVMPNTDEILRQIGQWKVIIKTDCKDAYYQMELSKNSLKYVGVVTPFRGVLVYTRSVMGLAGSESALEQLLSKILGDLIMEGQVIKLADDLYAGADNPQDLAKIWDSVLNRFMMNGIKLSPKKTVICPRSTEILGWIWEQGTLRASPHRLNALSECSPPETIKALRSFIGAYKFCCRVLPAYSSMLSPLDKMCAGAKSSDRITWNEDLINAFTAAKDHLKDAKVLTLPRHDDKLQIICDASKTGLASALYVIRDKPTLAGIFNVQVRGNQSRWLPCELEALSIGSGVNHFAPYIVQSSQITEVITDSKPCVDAYNKLQQGSFSASARVTSFLSIISRYGVKLVHIAGNQNVLSDYFSRNPITCDGECQICSFVKKADSAVVREVQVSDILAGNCPVPYTTRSTWLQTQQDCPVLREVSRYLTEGRSPSKKKKGMKDIKRYLNIVKVSSSPNDGLLVVPQEIPLGRTRQRIVVPRDIVDGLITALHLHTQHSSKHQMKQIFSRGFFALDGDKAIDKAINNCHTCVALMKVPSRFVQQSTTVPPDEGIGKRFSTDVIRREAQFILLIKEYVSAYCDACFIPGEKATDLEDGITRLMAKFRAPCGPPVIIRTDQGKCFQSINAAKSLSKQHITLELGEVKNVNKNPSGEKAISEFHSEVQRLVPQGGPLDEVSLSLAISNLNSRIRHGGLSASEVWYQRDMQTGEQLPIRDIEVIRAKAASRIKGHHPSAKYKARGSSESNLTSTSPGDIIYLYQDRDKTRSRDKYIVVQSNKQKSRVQKFVGNQLRSKIYEVDNADIIKIKPYTFTPVSTDSDSDINVKYQFNIENQLHTNETHTTETPDSVDGEEVHLTDDDSSYDEESYNGDPQESFNDENVSLTDLDDNVSARDMVVNEGNEPDFNVTNAVRPRRERKPPSRYDDYLTGRRLSQAVPRE